MNGYVFRSNHEHYDRNARDGAIAQAVPAILEGHTAMEPGIAIRVGRTPCLVIPTSDALRLAHEIADAAAQQRATQTARP